jgi:nucleoside-diphosphate-sugar epimerase
VQLASFGTPKHQPTVDDAIRILLTGGAGFIASHVALQLVERYPACEVSCYKNEARKCANAQNIGHLP